MSTHNQPDFTNLRAWIRALRSGPYVQCIDTLCMEGLWGDIEHCANGVLCDLYQQANPDKCQWQLMSPTTGIYQLAIDDNLAMCYTVSVPRLIQAWTGAQTESLFAQVAATNDAGKSFRYIAHMLEDWINTEGATQHVR